MVCLCRSLYITRLVKQRQFFMSVLSVRGFGPYFLKKPKQTNNQKTQKTSFGNISFSWTSASAVAVTSCKWLGTERAMGTIFVGIHFPKRIPLGFNVIQHFIILKHVPGGGCRLQTCPECFTSKICHNHPEHFSKCFSYYDSRLLYYCLNAKASFQSDIPWKKMTPFFWRFPKTILCIFMNLKYSVIGFFFF